MERSRLNELGTLILDAAICVHRELGPGLLESAYQVALRHELEIRNLHVQYNVPIDLVYKNINLGKSYVIDLLVEDEVIIENKSCETILPVHIAQVITYLKTANKHLGYLINFNVPLVKDGFRRIVYNF